MSTKLGRVGEAGRDGVTPDPTLVVSALLRYGVLVSALFIIAGLVLLLVKVGPRAFITMPRVRSPESATDLTTLRAVLHELLPPEPEAMIEAGLLVLIATPMLSVGVSAVWFALERDWVYVGLATFVFLVLVLGFAIERGGAVAGH